MAPDAKRALTDGQRNAIVREVTANVHLWMAVQFPEQRVTLKQLSDLGKMVRAGVEHALDPPPVKK